MAGSVASSRLRLRRFWLVVLLLLLSGCLSAQRTAYRPDEASKAEVGAFSNIRMNLDADLPGAADAPSWAPRTAPDALDYLVISGGGSGGAFTAGVLKAWSEAGTRPEFDMVSGVSTGALIAPFAFLGPGYDDLLVHLYTSGVAERLVERKFLARGLLGTSLLEPQPLRDMVERHVTADLLAAIAAEHRNGRRLLVLTSNLDSQTAVIWNMGAIADSGDRGALRLFQDVLIASASIPGVYPAVLIKAASGGRSFEEMHSDGGSASQFLALPEGLLTSEGRARPPRTTRFDMYVLVNNALIPEFATVRNSTFSVMSRAYSSLVKSQTRSSLLATYGYARRAGMGFHLASIDRQIPYDAADPFDTGYMRAVFRLGYDEMKAGTLWKDRPVFPLAPPPAPSPGGRLAAAAPSKRPPPAAAPDRLWSAR